MHRSSIPAQHHWSRSSLVRRPSLACATAAPAAFTHSSTFASSSAQHHRIAAQLRHSTASRAAAAPSRADTFSQVQDLSEGFLSHDAVAPSFLATHRCDNRFVHPRGRADCTRARAPPAEQQRRIDAASLLHVAADILQQGPPHFSISAPSRTHLVAVRRCGHTTCAIRRCSLPPAHRASKTARSCMHCCCRALACSSRSHIS